MALSNAVSPNGLVRNSTAPAFIACTVIGTSPWPLMKMIGMSLRSTATRFCSSRPLSPGRETSSTRQLGAKIRGRSRKSCAEANVSGCHPSLRISSSSDSRTEMSSSTTNTIGVAAGDTGDGLTARLEQALYRTSLEQSWADGLILITSDEDDRNLFPAQLQFLLQFGSGHARHGDVQDQAVRLVNRSE